MAKSGGFFRSIRNGAQVPTLQRLVEPLERRGANVPDIQKVPQAPSQGVGSGGGTSGSSGKANRSL